MTKSKIGCSNLGECKTKTFWGLKLNPDKERYCVDFHIKRMGISLPLWDSFQSFQSTKLTAFFLFLVSP